MLPAYQRVCLQGRPEDPDRGYPWPFSVENDVLKPSTEEKYPKDPKSGPASLSEVAPAELVTHFSKTVAKVLQTHI